MVASHSRGHNLIACCLFPLRSQTGQHQPTGTRRNRPLAISKSLMQSLMASADCGWVCENHPDQPWEGENACPCGGAGMPCRICNMSDDEAGPRLPKGFKTQFDKKGWRH